MPRERDAMDGPGQDGDDRSKAYRDQKLRGGPSEAYFNQAGRSGNGMVQMVSLHDRSPGMTSPLSKRSTSAFRVRSVRWPGGACETTKPPGK